jgi:sialic acid synthase SpsE
VLMNEFTIGGQNIGGGASPFIIAEAGSNFNQSLDTARKLIDVAAEAGADAVKFQLFRADILYPGGGELQDIFKSIELNPEWVAILNRHAMENGIQLMASAFDRGSVDVLEAINTPAHKIASSETTNLPFLHYVASKGRPIIISTGMCDMVDVEEAVNVCIGAGNHQIILLQCGAMYPLPRELVNLRVIPAFSERFRCPVGFSDHTMGYAAAFAAIGVGAKIFEKHFTLDRQLAGPDHFYALEPSELKTYVSGLREAHAALGSEVKEMLPEEKKLGRREGLYAARDLQAGAFLTTNDISVRRPAVGLRSRYAGSVAGANLARDIKKGDPITWESLKF